jgi:prolyl-tRNA synthetase
MEEAYQILDFYTSVYEDLLAVPVVKGEKTSVERFPGAHRTLSIEGFIPATGRGIQAATSHCLGKSLDITRLPLI